MQLQKLWVLVLTSLLILLKPLPTEALSLNYPHRIVDINSSLLVGVLSEKSSEMFSIGQSPKDSGLVFPDYLQRGHIISVYEKLVAQSPDSSIFLGLLADQYLRRFREIGDLEDVLRAEQAARKSLKVQPNKASIMLLASSLLSQHQFHKALEVIDNPQNLYVDDLGIIALKASIVMELGDYETSHKLLQKLNEDTLSSSARNALVARYLELTGDLEGARKLLHESIEEIDSFYTYPAETRAWFHVRAGDLAFAAGDFVLSEQRYQEALELFPRDIAAFTGLARLYACEHKWQDALNAANQGIELMPLVETLAYKADAQQALGLQSQASQTEDLIEVVAYLSKIKGIYDRALAVYYIEHNIHLPEALEIARNEITVRDDIYAEDTLAWAAAANNQWPEAEQAAQKATRYGTEDALLQYHAGMIALHSDNREEGINRLVQALKTNPQFHQKYADEARQILVSLAQDDQTKKVKGSSL